MTFGLIASKYFGQS